MSGLVDAYLAQCWIVNKQRPFYAPPLRADQNRLRLQRNQFVPPDTTIVPPAFKTRVAAVG